MTLFIILCSVFIAVGLMVFLGERFAKPITEKQQGKYSKIITGLVFFLIIAVIIREII
jgi:uncharacterized membrane protein